MKKFLNFILYSLFSLIVLGLLLLFLLPSVSFLGNYEVKVVKSGSMEPAIMTGAVVLVKEEISYKIGDVITFATEGADIPTSHRIIGFEERNGEVVFETKGDANEDADIGLVAKENILGKVVLDLPYIGYILDFARQPLGFALLIGIPALIIILDEIENIWKELRRGKNKEEMKEELDVLVIAPYQPGLQPKVKVSHVRKGEVLVERVEKLVERNRTEKRVTAPKAMSAFVIIFSIMTVSLWENDTIAYYTSEFLSKANNFQAQTLDFSVTADRETLNLDESGFLADNNKVAVEVKNEVLNDLKFDIKAESLGGDLDFCAAIWLETDLSMPYSGKLLNFNDFGYLMDKDFNLNFSLIENADIDLVPGRKCSVTFNFSGYLSGVEEKQGYVVEKDLVLNFVVEGLENKVITPLSFGVSLNSSEAVTVDGEKEEVVGNSEESGNDEKGSDETGKSDDETVETEGGDEVDLGKGNDDSKESTTDAGVEETQVQNGDVGSDIFKENEEKSDNQGEEGKNEENNREKEDIEEVEDVVSNEEKGSSDEKTGDETDEVSKIDEGDGEG